MARFCSGIISLAVAALLPSAANAQSLQCSLSRQADGAHAGECRSGDTAVVQLRLTQTTDSEWSGVLAFRDGTPEPVTFVTYGTRGVLRNEGPWRAAHDVSAIRTR